MRTKSTFLRIISATAALIAPLALFIFIKPIIARKFFEAGAVLTSPFPLTLRIMVFWVFGIGLIYSLIIWMFWIRGGIQIKFAAGLGFIVGILTYLIFIKINSNTFRLSYCDGFKLKLERTVSIQNMLQKISNLREAEDRGYFPSGYIVTNLFPETFGPKNQTVIFERNSLIVISFALGGYSAQICSTKEGKLDGGNGVIVLTNGLWLRLQ